MADRDEGNLIEQTEDASRKIWATPALARLNAGDAEQGSTATTDLGLNFS
jgi:hypothetical protein